MALLKAAYSRLDEVGKNILVQSGGTIASQAIPILASPILTRLYNPKEFGIYGLVVYIASLLAIFFSLRIDHGVIVAPSDDKARLIAKSALLITGGATIIFAIAASIGVVALGYDNSTLFIWSALCPLAGLCIAAYRTMTLWNNRVRNFPLVSRSRIQRAIWISASSIAMGFWSYGLVAGLVIGNLAGIILLGKGFQRRPLPRLHEVRDTIRENRRFILFSLPADVINRTAARVPMVVFPILFGLDQTGYLSLTYLVIAAPTSFVGTAVGEVFYSYAAREYEKTGTCLPTVLRIGKLLGALSILGFGTLFVLSGFVFGQVFGADWTTAGKFAQAIMPMLAIAFISSPLSVVLYISGRQKEDLLWQIGFLITTVASLYLGYLISGDPVTALIILGASGFAMYLIYLVMIVRFATSRKIAPAAAARQG